MRTTLRIALILLSFTGAALSYLLLAMQGPAGAPLVNALCSPTAKLNCTDVLNSPWARLGPLPSSAWGLIYFAFLAVWFAAIGLPNRRGRAWHLIPTMTACIGIGISAWLLHAMATRLPTWCIWCIITHGVNLLLLIACLLAWKYFSEPRSVLQSRDREGAVRETDEQFKPIARAPAFVMDTAYPSFTRVGIVNGTFLAILLIAGLASYAAMQSAVAKTWRKLWMESANTPDYIAWRHSTAPLNAIPVRDDDPMLGDRDAPHTVVVFSDFQCPWCKQLDGFLHEVAKRHAQRVCIVFKHYPLNAACNERIKQTASGQHPFACDAALAAEAARRTLGPRRAVEYHATLFQNADRFATHPYAALAATMGVSETDFNRFYHEPMTLQRVREDVKLAHMLKVESSGIVFLDGRRMSAWQIMDTRDPSRIDSAATMALWDRLLN